MAMIKRDLTIYKPNGDEYLSVVVGEGSVMSASLMSEDYIKIKFSSATIHRFKRGCWCIVPSTKKCTLGKKYVLCSEAYPTYNDDTGGYDYELSLDAWYMDWKRVKLSLNPTYGAIQTSFSYTDKIESHVSLLISQMVVSGLDIPDAVAFHHIDRVDYWSCGEQLKVVAEGDAQSKAAKFIDGNSDDHVMSVKDTTMPFVLIESVTIPEDERAEEGTNEASKMLNDEVRNIQYADTDIISAIGQICSEDGFDCEWWVDDNNVLNFGRCEIGTPLSLSHGNQFVSIQRNDASQEYGTRLIAFGSTKNVPSRYRKKLIFEVTATHQSNGYWHFTDGARKVPVSKNRGSRYYGEVAEVKVGHSQLYNPQEEYIDIDTQKIPTKTHPHSYLGIKKTRWQRMNYYDCVLKSWTYEDCKVEVYNLSAGERIRISGTPTNNKGHFLYRIDRTDGTVVLGDMINSGSVVGEIDKIITDDIGGTISCTITGDISIIWYESTKITYHSIAYDLMPTLDPGKYRIHLEDVDFGYRINGEFKGEAGDQYIDIDVYETGKLQMDAVNTDKEGVGPFTIRIDNLDYYYICPKVTFIDGSLAGSSVYAYINVAENTIRESNKKGNALPSSKNSFVLSTILNPGVGSHFVVDGFSDEDVPIDYFTDNYDSDATISSYERRLMLPSSKYPANRIDSGKIEDSKDVVEVVKVFDDIYPQQDLTIADVGTWIETVTNTDDDGSKYSQQVERYSFCISRSQLEFKQAYIMEGSELQCIFQTGKLAGITVSLAYDGNRDGNKQCYLIKNNNSYGVDIPNKYLCPSVGDKLVFLNYNPTYLISSGFVSDAEDRLEKAALAYLDKISIDAAEYTITMSSKWSEDSYKGESGYPGIGQKVSMTCNVYFDGVRNTRVIGYERCLDIPWDAPKLKLGESLRYSRIKSIESKIK